MRLDLRTEKGSAFQIEAEGAHTNVYVAVHSAYRPSVSPKLSLSKK